MIDKQMIVKVGARMAVDFKGFRNVGCEDIARRLKVTPAAVRYHVDNTPTLQNEIVKYAFRNFVRSIMAQALAERHWYARRWATDDQKREAAHWLTA